MADAEAKENSPTGQGATQDKEETLVSDGGSSEPASAANINGKESGEPPVNQPSKEEAPIDPSSKGGDPGNQDDAPPSALEEKIIRQIEYYFGDRNLPKDKFLQQAVASGEDGYVPIATLLTFNRLKALSSNEELIAGAVRKARRNLLQLNDDGTSVRRHPDNPLPDIFSPEVRKKIKGKSVYAKGFSETTTLDQLQTFFDTFGKVENIQMRRMGVEEERKFKGSVFVEFVDKESADRFLSQDSVKYEDVELVKESKEDYFNRKNEERKQKKRSTETMVGGLDKEGRQETETSRVLKKGCVLHFNGCGEKPTWESIKEVLSEYATVAFVDFSDDRTEGYVRFKEEGGAEKAKEGLMEGLSGDQKPQLLGVDTQLRVLTGSEEEGYWEKMEESKSNKRKTGSRGRSIWSGGRKRKHRQHSDSKGEKPSDAKLLKTED